ncbi:unnamed protein product, partial [marine sediment metagenome]
DWPFENGREEKKTPGIPKKARPQSIRKSDQKA